MGSIFLDTAPLIYYLDGSEPFATKVEQFLLSAMNSGKGLCTSTITDTEYFVLPYREGNVQKINVYKSFLKDANISKNGIDEATAEKAAQIRAKYQRFNAPLKWRGAFPRKFVSQTCLSYVRKIAHGADASRI